MSILRDPFINKPHVNFYVTKRVGGGPRFQCDTGAETAGIVHQGGRPCRPANGLLYLPPQDASVPSSLTGVMMRIILVGLASLAIFGCQQTTGQQQEASKSPGADNIQASINEALGMLDTGNASICVHPLVQFALYDEINGPDRFGKEMLKKLYENDLLFDVDAASMTDYKSDTKEITCKGSLVHSYAMVTYKVRPTANRNDLVIEWSSDQTQSLLSGLLSVRMNEAYKKQGWQTPADRAAKEWEAQRTAEAERQNMTAPAPVTDEEEGAFAVEQPDAAPAQSEDTDIVNAM